MIASIYVTNTCNMRCLYCYQGQEKRIKDMDRPTIDLVTTFLADHVHKMNDSNVMVVVHGGEPLIAFHQIEYLVQVLKRKIPGVYFSITTNGVLLNDRIENFLYKEFMHISVSIDGTKETHDTNRLLHNNKGSYDLVIKNFTKLLKKRNDLRARMTFNSTTVSTLFEDVKHLANLGFKVITPVPDSFDNHWDTTHMQILQEQLTRIIDWKMKEHNDLEIGMINEASIKKKNGVCSGGVSSLSIDTDGSIYPCTYAVGNDEFRIGDVRDGIQLEHIEKIKYLDAIQNKECVGCTRYDYCVSTRCKIINKICTGDFHIASPITCNFENIKYLSSKHHAKMLNTSINERR